MPSAGNLTTTDNEPPNRFANSDVKYCRGAGSKWLEIETLSPVLYLHAPQVIEVRRTITESLMGLLANLKFLLHWYVFRILRLNVENSLDTVVPLYRAD